MFVDADSFCVDLCSWVDSCNPLPEFNDYSTDWDRIEPLKTAVDYVTSYPDPNTKAVFNYGGVMNCWDVSEVKSMSMLFNLKMNFNINIASWKTDNVTSMNQMFYEAREFNQNVASWKTDKVMDMYRMFSVAKAFNQNLASWNTNKVTSMDWMFSQAYAFNQNMCQWLDNPNFPNNMDTMWMFSHSKCDFKLTISNSEV